MSFTKTFFAALLLTLFAALPARAQIPAQDEQFVIEMARPGTATMTLYLWGTFGRPGIWRVERDVDLIELLSAARVPGIGTTDVDFRQRTILKIYRGTPGSRREVFSKKLEELVAEGAAYPDLQDQDVLELETRRRPRLSVRTVVQYVGSISSLALLTLRLIRGRRF